MLIFYLLGLLSGALFGWLQYRFLSRALLRQGWKRLPLVFLKLLLWSGSMVLLALWSIPVLICFVAGATAVMIREVIRVYRRSKEE